MSLPEKLAVLRKKNGLTQLELAEKLCVSRQAVSRWEVGTAVPTVDNLKVLSELYGVTVDCLLREEGDSPVAVETTREQTKEAKSKWDWKLFACVLALMLSVAALVYVVTARNREPKRRVDQITDLTAKEDSDYEGYATGYFDLFPLG